MLKKASIKQQGLNTNDQDVQFCFFCNKKAEFKCSECLQATYCTPQHQKADWPSHKRRCIRPEDKLKDLYKHLQTSKKLFFEKLSKKVMNQCESIGDNILKISEQIVTKFPSPLHEIEYGTAICCYVKMLLSVKSFNEAQQILNNYFKQRNDFLTDTSTIPQKIQPQNPNYNNIIKFVEGKLKLLSVLCNLAHQTVRNSVDMIQILLRHCQKFYGPTSLQVSNVYFQLGNYYFFLNQSMKACACYLLAGDMRKQKGVCAYFNAAVILMKNQSYTQSIRFLQKCLSMVLTNGDPNQLIDRIYLALANCYKKLNHFDFTVHYLERALCQINLKNRFDKTEKPHIQKLLKWLSEEYRKQFNNDQILSLPREKPVPQRQPIISNANLEDFWDLDANNDKKKKADEWIKSFKNEKQKTKFESKIPMSNPLLQKVLFVNHFIDEKNEESNTTPANKSSNAYEYINIDLEFMEKLTATEVRFMNQLNRLLVINKDKPNLHDVIESSNLMQELSKEKIQRFYQLNPELMRQKEDYNLMGEEQQPYQQSANRKGGQVQTEPKIKTPRLDLSKVPKNS